MFPNDTQFVARNNIHSKLPASQQQKYSQMVTKFNRLVKHNQFTNLNTLNNLQIDFLHVQDNFYLFTKELVKFPIEKVFEIYNKEKLIKNWNPFVKKV